MRDLHFLLKKQFDVQENHVREIEVKLLFRFVLET